MNFTREVLGPQEAEEFRDTKSEGRVEGPQE